jgi:deoxyribonuclease-1
MYFKIFILAVTTISSSVLMADGNTSIQSFNKAKKALMKSVYTTEESRKTIYCNAAFDAKKNVIAPEGFTSKTHIKRSKRVEFEHIVPAQNFGQTFKEWREGHPECVNRKAKAFKGRKCAEKINHEYRYMQADMYNLYAAIGSVNALRSNYNFQMLPGEKSDFGSCEMIIDSRKAQPPESSRGKIARAYMYMEQAYPRYKMSKAQRKLMSAWDKQFPISKEECRRSKQIEKSQGNENKISIQRCHS